MKPLMVLLVAIVISLVILRLVNGEIDYTLAGRIAMSVMLLFTSIAHFAFTKGMVMMLPPFIPFKTGIVYLTGLIEIAAAIGLIIPHFSEFTGWVLFIFFILLLPANIYAASKHIDYEKANFEGKNLNYLWLRIPLQIVFMLWVYVSTIK